VFPEIPPVRVPASPAHRPLWRNLLVWALRGLGLLLALMGVIGCVVWWLNSSGRLVPMILRLQAAAADGTGDPLERPWPETNAIARPRPPLRTDLASVGSPAGLFQPTNVWEARFAFSAVEWPAMQPKPVRARTGFNRPDGKFPLMNTNASRNGLLGALGLDLDWTTARVTFGGIELSNASVRFKGNGTYLGAMGGVKRPLKVDLAHGDAQRTVAGESVLNFGNLNADCSCLSDTLAYETFRAAGVPAPRTAFAHVTVSATGRWESRPFGLYVLVENIDGTFLRERPGMAKYALFKPVTYELFSDLGDDWAGYQRIYDAKHGLTDAAKARVIAAAKVVSHATDAEFARQAGEFFDLDEVARFVAVNALISSYDGFLNNGQNFYMYLDPASGRFGFIPWDLDRAWGEFPYTGTLEEREQASIRRPWVADNRLLERLFAVPEFQAIYLRRLEEIFRAQLDPHRLSHRVDALAAVVRPALVDDSDLRKAKFEEAVTSYWNPAPARNDVDTGPWRPAHQLKRFFVRRHGHVAAQLAGTETGVEFLKREVPGQKPRSKGTR